MLSFVQITPPVAEASTSVIWLHGLGADGHDFVPFVKQLDLLEKGVRFILPHAPSMSITINGGAVMPAWYDIITADFFSDTATVREDESGIRHSQTMIEALIDHEIESGIAAENIFLAGFSQGGAMALHTGLRYEKRLGGILALSTYLPLADKLLSKASAVNAGLPILMMHGAYDTIIPCQAAQHSKALLQRAGYFVTWYDFPIQHAVCQDQLSVIQRWWLGKDYKK